MPHAPSSWQGNEGVISKLRRIARGPRPIEVINHLASGYEGTE
jgi:hypothetical protein